MRHSNVVFALILTVGSLAMLPASAQQTPQAEAPQPSAAQAEPTTMGTVVVTGSLPGPGLWRVTSGQHTLYILGTISPLPSGMDWNASDVEEVLARAQEVIAPGRAQGKVGIGAAFKMAPLARSAMKAIRIPDRQTLQDLLPAPVFSQWRSLKAKYRPDDTAVERDRPILASQELYFSAIDASGMTRSALAWNRVSELAKAKGIAITETSVSYPLVIDHAKYKAGIQALSDARADDEVTCFAATLDTLESDLEVMKQAANAWATGDPALLEAPGNVEGQPACKAEYDRLMGFQERPELAAQVRAKWLAAAKAALERNQVTLAVLPIAELVGADGQLAQLSAKGYQVSAPDDVSSDEPARANGS